MLKKIDPSKKHPQALVLSPTYELAQQVCHVFGFSAILTHEIENSLENTHTQTQLKFTPNECMFSFVYLLQTGKVIEEMAKFCTGVSCIFSVRGNVQPRGTKLTQQIVIGTPGTTLDWALKLKFFDPKLIKVCVF